MADKKLQIIPIGGLGEFGMNSMALRYGDDIIVVDAGMMFPESELLGVDIVTPDFTYLEQHAQMVRGLVLTHGHEDHIGGMVAILNNFRPRELWIGAAGGVLLSYASAIASNLRAGRRMVACGCGGPDRQRPIAGWMVWRNVLLSAVAAMTMLPWNERQLQWTDAATVGCGLLAIALLYACADRLLGELRRARVAGAGGTP